ncbi:histidine phosphatase family protein [Streptosporangium sp. NBC_01639]|uniref:SixA phosphatase family protein n=1 Tax=unclassified Streptosporangium TaxID=2632669 RepID=UPI002DD7B1C7|nr:histidine phosphatase family protein [Streptosporangium sp. NBC_01756]WSC82982.1 histidine phosphatase family protein [Streptosporangium sp. NBC_01756]WTD58468.1 histidine phosphatase family protein [Streptosporangium sp. NBC_01639]
MTTRTLIVLRHAKAAHVPGLADRERPLTTRGEHDARRIGEVLTHMDLRPDLVLCSPATRTRQTADLALPDADIVVEPAIYEAYPDELLTLIRQSAPEVRTLVLVGHNPGVHELVMGLTTRDGDSGFPPGAFAVIETEDEWGEFDIGRGVSRWTPKDD